MTCLQRPGLRAPLPSTLSEAGSPASQVVRNWVFSTGFQGKSWGVAVHPHTYAPCVCRQTQSNTQTQGPSHGHKTPPGISVRPCSWQRRVHTHTLQVPHAHTPRAHICTRSHARPGAQAHTETHHHTDTPGAWGEGQPGALPAHTPPSSSWALLLQFLHLFYSPFYRQRLSKHFRLVY